MSRRILQNQYRQLPAGYRAVRHPQTGRFCFAYDPERQIALLYDRGSPGAVDLTLLQDEASDDADESRLLEE